MSIYSCPSLIFIFLGFLLVLFFFYFPIIIIIIIIMTIRTLLDNTITENYCVLELRATFIVAGENPQPLALNDNFVVMVRLVPANLKYFSLSNFYLGSKCLIGTLSPVVVPNDSHS